MASPAKLTTPPALYTGKQPNFLQKLYHFLALTPQPCAEVIYWSADSKLLVIAEPDRLVKEVLPYLFKHDKLSSFGRQLNIYGFSRLYPGRQFKDADGNVSDASVWSHPSLHRASTAEEIAAVKRRAAPKLIRTRRLANGDIVRSKAGQAVHDKFEQMQAVLAKSARRRSASIAPPKLTLDSPLTASSYSSTPNAYSSDTSPVDRTIYTLPESNLPPQADRPVAFFRASSLTVDTRLIQSCPASLHSSPVFSSAQPTFTSWQSPQSWESNSAISPLDWDQNWLPTPIGSPHPQSQGILAMLDPLPVTTLDPSWVSLSPWPAHAAYPSSPAACQGACICGACDQWQRNRPLSSIWEGENEDAKKQGSTMIDPCPTNAGG